MAKKPRSDKANGTFGHKLEMSSQEFDNRNDYAKPSKQNTQAKYDHRQSQLQDSKDYSSFKVVLFYCSLIVFLPVVTFFMLKSFVLESIFDISEVQGNIYSAVGAVIALHIALGLYIYRAYFSGSPLHEGTRKKLN